MVGCNAANSLLFKKEKRFATVWYRANVPLTVSLRGMLRLAAGSGVPKVHLLVGRAVQRSQSHHPGVLRCDSNVTFVVVLCDD